MRKQPEEVRSKRFQVVLSEPFVGSNYHTIAIVKDTLTGVCYLRDTFSYGGAGGVGLTPLLDKDGKPVVELG